MSVGDRHGRLAVRQSFLARLFHALFAPATPQSAHLAEGDRLVIERAGRTDVVLLNDVVDIAESPGVVWRGLAIELRGGRRLRLSGLSDSDVAPFRTAAAAAREQVARAAMASRADALAAAALLLQEMRSPPRYVRLSTFRTWLPIIERCLADLPARPPSAPDMQDAVRMLAEIQDALRDPESMRSTSNATFLREEIERTREFLDRVESKPLTFDQRRAVVVDEDRNLVVAAAGSGKTSVIVAKVAHLVHRDLCSSSSWSSAGSIASRSS